MLDTKAHQCRQKRDTDVYDPRVDRVTLMTLPAAKGLKFLGVCIIGCKKGLLPYQRNDERSDLFKIRETILCKQRWQRCCAVRLRTAQPRKRGAVVVSVLLLKNGSGRSLPGSSARAKKEIN